MGAWRCFVAVEIGSEIRRNIEKIVEELKRTDADVRWVSVDNLHLTVKFLGPTETNRMGDLSAALERAAKLTEPFELDVAGLRPFPSRSRFQVVAAGTKSIEAMGRLAADVEEACAELGWRRETRAYRAHLTLGRVRSPRGTGRLLEAMDDWADRPFGGTLISSLVLFRSELDRDGAQYTELARFNLGSPVPGTGTESRGTHGQSSYSEEVGRSGE